MTYKYSVYDVASIQKIRNQQSGDCCRTHHTSHITSQIRIIYVTLMCNNNIVALKLKIYRAFVCTVYVRFFHGRISSIYLFLLLCARFSVYKVRVPMQYYQSVGYAAYKIPTYRILKMCKTHFTYLM